MDNNWAAQHLQTIRTLMERSALYRRALAPVSTFVGVVGIVAAVVGGALRIEESGRFALYWMLVGLFAVCGALLLVRRQSLKQGETFWSPPTRRIVQAMLPALFIGMFIGCIAVVNLWNEGNFWSSLWLIIIWTVLYGLALHAAGFFMPRGIRLFSWAFIAVSMITLLLCLTSSTLGPIDHFERAPHWLMGLFFGASHLAYGIYLYFTERKNEA